MMKEFLGLGSLLLLAACGADISVGDGAAGAGAGAGTGGNFSTGGGGASPGGGVGGHVGGASPGPGGTGGVSSCDPVSDEEASHPSDGSVPLCVTWTDPTAAPDCSAHPTSERSYTPAELPGLFVGRWRRCIDAQFPGEDVGVEISADGKYYPLTLNAAHEVVRRIGPDFESTWQYLPPGSSSPISSGPVGERGLLVLGGVYTDPPHFQNDPYQMRITFSPVLGRYLPLTQ